MPKRTIDSVKEDGSIVEFTDKTRILVLVSHHPISKVWEAGDEVELAFPKGEIPGTVHCQNFDKSNTVNCAWYDGNNQIHP